MAISFEFLEMENMEVPIDREILLDKAILLLDKQNQIAKQEALTMFFRYALYQDGREVYQSTAELPQEKFDLFATIVAEIEAQEFENEEQKEVFLQWVSQAFKRKIKRQRLPKKEEEPKVPKPTKVKKRRRKPTMNKNWLFAALLVFLLMIVGGSAYFAMNQQTAPSSLESLLKEEKYLEAGKEFPKERKAIENELFSLTRSKDKSYLKQLMAFNKQYPTIQGDFDLAMFDFNYKQACSIYEKDSSTFAKDKERLPLVGYSYLKIGQIEQAKNILKQCNDAELEKFILQYEQASLIIQEKQKEIKELQKKPSENKEKIKKAINELYEAKEQLNQF
jgi:hypothetical protein